MQSLKQPNKQTNEQTNKGAEDRVLKQLTGVKKVSNKCGLQGPDRALTGIGGLARVRRGRRRGRAHTRRLIRIALPSPKRERREEQRPPPQRRPLLSAQAAETKVLRARWSGANARPPKPASIIAQVEVSGTVLLTLRQ